MVPPQPAQLVVLLDHLLSGLDGAVGVDAERLDAELAPERQPLDVRDRDRRERVEARDADGYQ